MNIFKSYCFLALLLISNYSQAQYPSPLVRYTSFVIGTGNMEIRWEPSIAPNVTYYQVRYYYPGIDGLSGGWVPIGANISASGDLSLIFDPAKLSNVTPLNEPVAISVQAYDNIKSLNTLEIFDSTLFLQADYDSCQATANLTWNLYNYKQWNQPGTSEYQIYISDDDGATFNLATTLPANIDHYSLTGLRENEDYIIYVSAISRNNPGDVANSNPVSINTEMAILPNYMYANYASYNNGAVDVSFSIDPDSEMNTYNLLRSNTPDGEYDTIYQFIGGEKELSTTDFVNYYAGPYYYKLGVINYCKVYILESENMASSLLLEREGAPLTPLLNWNEYLEWLNGVSSYAIERKFRNSDFAEIANISTTNFTDTELESLVENNFEAEVCYRITALESGGTHKSESNPVCYDLPVNIRFEFDAFMPGSGTGNDTFGPTIDFIPDEYIFRVLDRIGRKVYESKDPTNTRWDGYINGSLAQEGIYMCVVQYRIGEGKKQTIHGAVAVVY